MIDLHTHERIDTALCGAPLENSPGLAKIEMTALPSMTVDVKNLIHGGFVFGLADHAAMIAVNHPNVVLAGAEVRFIRPVTVGDVLVAEGRVAAESGKRRTVEVVVRRGDETVFEGTFACAVLERHVLDNMV